MISKVVMNARVSKGVVGSSVEARGFKDFKAHMTARLRCDDCRVRILKSTESYGLQQWFAKTIMKLRTLCLRLVVSFIFVGLFEAKI